MYLSQVVLDLRNRRVQRVLENPYRLHQAILAAFPPDAPGGGGRVLFRIEPEMGDGRALILVQSALKPEWTSQELGELLPIAGMEPPKKVELALRPGQLLRFRLRANPTRRSQEKRLPVLGEERQTAWLGRKLKQGGLELVAVRQQDEGMIHGVRQVGGRGERMTFVSVLFEGITRVVEPDQAVESIRSGIGSAKAFGFGLLSVARA